MGDSDSESIEDKAERGKPGPKGSQKEAAERNEEIVRDRLRRRSWKWIADRHGVSDRHCREVWARWRETAKPTFEGRDPIDIVHGMLDFYDAKVDELGEVAEAAENDSTRVSALNAQMQAMGKAAELCQVTGILPKNLGTLRLELDVRVLAQKLITVLNDHDASLEMKRAILEALGREEAPALPAGAGE